MNSDLSHSGTETAVAQEEGLTHSPIPIEAPFCLGLAERGSLDEGTERGWEPLSARGQSPLGSTVVCRLYPHSLHLEVKQQFRALKPTFRLPPIQACRCGGTKEEGLVIPGSVTPAESPARFPDSLSPPPLPSIFFSTDGANPGRGD